MVDNAHDFESVFVCSGGGQPAFSALDLVIFTTQVMEQSGRPTWGTTDFSFLQMGMSPDDERPVPWPPCYFAGPCDCSSVGGRRSALAICGDGSDQGGSVEHVTAVSEVSSRELKKLMDAHVRFGHRNFRSIATALNLRMPSRVPFCRACIEAKATRHPRSRVPHAPRSLPPRPGYRIHFDPFGPFADRLGDGSYYGILFADACSSLLWFDTMPTLGAWFGILKALILKVETDKGSNRVVAELACDSAAMFKINIEFRTYAEPRVSSCSFPLPTRRSLTPSWSVLSGRWSRWR